MSTAGPRSALSAGTARFSTVRSIESIRHGRAITASPIYSRRVPWACLRVLVIAGYFDDRKANE
jgi:hypothetical protein